MRSEMHIHDAIRTKRHNERELIALKSSVVSGDRLTAKILGNIAEFVFNRIKISVQQTHIGIYF